MIYIIGHQNPDTDSIVSAIVLADYFNKTGKKAKALRVGKLNKETNFILSKAKTKPPSLAKTLAGKKVFLVDHNELKQAGPGIEKAEISGILDHHKLGGISTKDPIYARLEPIGSTSALIFKIFQETNFKISKTHAFLLLSGIVLDTLNLTSPTTTKEDKKALQALAKISKTNIKNFAEEVFKIRSDISGIKIKDLIISDYKDFKEKGVSFGIGVHETLYPENILKKEKEIFSALSALKKEKKIKFLFFALVDIFKKESYFFLENKEKEIAEKAFQKKKKIKDNLFLLPGVVSRKKQMGPPILEVL